MSWGTWESRKLKLRGAIKLQLLVALFLDRSKLWPRLGLSRCGVVTIDKLVAEWVGVWMCGLTDL
jgi:hypothetical protein